MSENWLPDDMTSDIMNQAAADVEAMPQRPPFKADMVLAIALARLDERKKASATPTLPRVEPAGEAAIPADIMEAGSMLWIEALRDGTPDAGLIIARALLAERQKATEAAAQRIEAYLIEAFGERCPEFCEGCPSCEAWAQYAAIRASLNTNQAPHSSPEALAAGPVGSPPAGPATPFTSTGHPSSSDQEPS